MAIKFLSGQTIDGTLTVSGNVQGATFNGLAINTTGTNNLANQIVRTQANGYANFGWINSVSGNHTGTITRITASNDAYLRYVTPAQFRTGVTDGYYAPVSTVSGVTSISHGNGITATPNPIISTGTLTMSGSYTGDYTITGTTTISSDTGLKIYTTTALVGANINFSDETTANNQNGTITYKHQDTASYGSANSFVINGTEATMTILADGKLMYNEGVYLKPATGTGAGTRKDNLWDAAYNDKITGLAVAGTTTKTLTATQQDGGTLTASWADNDSGGTVTGTGANTQVAFWTGTSVIDGSSSLKWDNTNFRLGIGITPTHALDIYNSSGTTSSATGTTIQRLWNYVGADLSQQKTFIDFVFQDGNDNEYPQVRIGAEVGQNGDADSQIKEGSGAFVVYTNNATGSTPGTNSLTERMRVDYAGNVGINDSSPSHKLSVDGTANFTGLVSGITPTAAANFATKAYVDAHPDGTVKGTGTATRVAFWSASDTLSSDADLYWDNTNNRLGVGLTSPSAPLHVVTSTDLSDALILEFAGTYQGGPYQTFQYNEGGAAPSESGDLIGGIRARAAYAAGTYAGYSTAIEFRNDAAISSTSAPGRIEFKTSAVNGVTPLERMRISSNGFGYFYNNFYLASAANQGNLFFGTADPLYNIFGGGTYGYMGYNTSGYHRFLTSSTERLRIAADGVIQITSGINGYINTNSIGMEMDINRNPETGAFTDAALSHARIIMRGDTVANGGSNIKFVTSPAINTVGTTKMTILGNGNVGIGATNPFAKLEVTGNLSNNWAGRFENTNSIGYGILAKINSTDSSDYIFQARTGSTNVMTILGDGNVGIGTDSPMTKLHIQSGNGSYPDDANNHLVVESSSHSYIGLGGGTSSDVGIHFGDSGGIAQGRIAYKNSDNSMRFMANSVERLLITSDGTVRAHSRLDVGSTTWTGYASNPVAKVNIEVAGGNALNIFNTSEDNAYLNFIDSQSNGSQYANLAFHSSTNFFTINNMGYITTISNAGSWTFPASITATGDVIAYSDERLKSNIKTLDGSKVLKMRGVSFDKDGKKGSGVIAQELEKVAPELVHNESEYKGVAYGNLTGYLIEAIKELKQEIEELKKHKCNCKE